MTIGIVPYLNALPLSRYLDLPYEFGTPAELEYKMEKGLLDIALLPSISFLKNKDYRPLFNVGVIQSSGPVQSVALFVKNRIKEASHIRTIFFSPESRTSIALFKTIHVFYWKRDLSEIKELGDPLEADAQLLIGDEALFFSNPDYWILDLGQIWQEWIRLPFVYALWVSRRDLDPLILEKLIKARDQGVENIDLIAKENHDLPLERLKYYLKNSIHYRATSDSTYGLKKFQHFCYELGLIKHIRPFTLHGENL